MIPVDLNPHMHAFEQLYIDAETTADLQEWIDTVLSDPTLRISRDFMQTFIEKALDSEFLNTLLMNVPTHAWSRLGIVDLMNTVRNQQTNLRDVLLDSLIALKTIEVARHHSMATRTAARQSAQQQLIQDNLASPLLHKRLDGLAMLGAECTAEQVQKWLDDLCLADADARHDISYFHLTSIVNATMSEDIVAALLRLPAELKCESDLKHLLIWCRLSIPDVYERACKLNG